MKNLVKLFMENCKDILYEESENIILHINNRGDIIDSNKTIEKFFKSEENRNINTLLVNSSYRNLFGEITMGHEKRIKLSFIPEENEFPISYNTWLIPLGENNFLLYGEPIPPFRQKEAKEYFKIASELSDTTRELQKNKFHLEKLSHELGEKNKILARYSEHLEEMVTERTKEIKELQEKLTRQEKLALLGQITGGIAHEIKNPLTNICNSAYFLKTVLLDSDETVKEYLDIMTSEVQRADEIVTNLTNFSRVKSVAEKEKVSIYYIIMEVIERISLPEKISLNNNISPDLPEIFIDPLQIDQVFTNLITNAFQSITYEGEVILRGERDGDYLIIYVKDSGCGIQKENLKKIFEPLYTTKSKGIGLGLAVTKTLVEVNGGKIEVESEEGEGTIFRVFLPLFI